MNLDLLELKRSIYRGRYLIAIRTNDLVINIDECTASRYTYRRKSWSSKTLKKSELRSISFAKSASIIWSILTEGWSFSLIRSTSVNSSNFIEYLRDLRKFIETKWKTLKRRTIILLYKASPHSGMQTTKFIIENLDAVFYLPQYTQVESFL